MTTTTTKNRWFLKKWMSKHALRWRFLSSSGFRWKWKRLNFKISFFDDVIFKILSIFEAVVLVSTLCFFFLCCGCHF